MNALILSCGTGGGHNAAACAIKEELENRGHTATFFDPYTLKSSRLARVIDNVYIGLAQHAPKVFGAVYAIGNLYRRLPWRSPVYFVNKYLVNDLSQYLNDHPADIIIMPHIFPAEILTYMRNSGMDIPETILIATDYTCIPFAEECTCDAYVTPSPRLTDEFIRRGVPADRIYPFGIPVRSCFQSTLSRQTAKAMLHLEADKHYLLISGGSIGASKLKKILPLLCKITAETDYRIIVICGTNESLRKELSRRYGGQAIILGSTDHIELYMCACDLYFTKPGGLSVTEAAVMEVPLALLPPIPGCESHNLRFFCRAKMAFPAKPSVGNLKKILTLLSAPENQTKMKDAQRKGISKNAAQSICDLAEKMVDLPQ